MVFLMSQRKNRKVVERLKVLLTGVLPAAAAAAAALATVLVSAAFSVARAAEPPASQRGAKANEDSPEELRRQADETVAAAKKAGENGMALAKAIQAGDSAAANTFVGQDVNVGGKPT